LSKVPLHCTKNVATDDNDSTLDGKLNYDKQINLCVLQHFCYCTELISSSANHSPNFNRPTSHKNSSSLLSKRKTRIPSINSIPVSVSTISVYTFVCIN